MRMFILCCATIAALLGAAAARADDGCPGGSTSVTSSPDGAALSILFDSFSVSAAGSNAGTALVKNCVLAAPLPVPPGYSLGVYRVDYRGFAHLAGRETAELAVDYHLGPKGKSRQYRRKVMGPTDDNFLFTENIGAGLMKRIGCGEPAVLNVSLQLSLRPLAADDALVTMDSSDGAAKGGLIYYFDFKKCAS